MVPSFYTYISSDLVLWNGHLEQLLSLETLSCSLRPFLRKNRWIVKIEEGGLDLFHFLFIFISIFYFHFNLFFHFLFLEQLGLGLIGHVITSITWWRSHKTDHKTWENLVEKSRTNESHSMDNTCWPHVLHMMV